MDSRGFNPLQKTDVDGLFYFPEIVLELIAKTSPFRKPLSRILGLNKPGKNPSPQNPLDKPRPI